VLEAPDHLQPSDGIVICVKHAGITAADGRDGAERHHHVSRSANLGAIKSGRTDTDDFEGMAVDGDGLANDVGMTAVFLLPETIAQDSASSATAQIVFRCQRAAERGVHAQGVKVLTRYIGAMDGMSLASRSEIEAPAAIGEDSGENVLTVAKMLPGWVIECRSRTHRDLK